MSKYVLVPKRRLVGMRIFRCRSPHRRGRFNAALLHGERQQAASYEKHCTCGNSNNNIHRCGTNLYAEITFYTTPLDKIGTKLHTIWATALVE